MFIPCQECKTSFDKNWNWYVCNECGKRVCMACLGSIGFKCNDCTFGYFFEKN